MGGDSPMLDVGEGGGYTAQSTSQDAKRSGSSGLALITEHLALIDRGESEPFPFYCALLYTRRHGLDARVHSFVHREFDDLSALIGPSCLTFVLASRRLPARRAAPANEVFEITRALGGEVSALPCAVFFTDPNRRSETRVVDLRGFLPAGDASTDSELELAFRALAAATDRLANQRHRNRLDALEKEARATRAEVFSGAPPWRKGAVQRAAANGRTVLATLADVVQVGGAVT